METTDPPVQSAVEVAPSTLEPLPKIPQSQMIGSIAIDAQNSIVIAPVYAGNNGNINNGVNGLPNMVSHNVFPGL